MITKKINSIGLFEKFEKKYTYEDLMLLAFVMPSGIRLTYKGVLSVYPLMSKNKIYEIIEIRKNLHSKIKQNLTKIS